MYVKIKLKLVLVDKAKIEAVVTGAYLILAICCHVIPDIVFISRKFWPGEKEAWK